MINVVMDGVYCVNVISHGNAALLAPLTMSPFSLGPLDLKLFKMFKQIEFNLKVGIQRRTLNLNHRVWECCNCRGRRALAHRSDSTAGRRHHTHVPSTMCKAVGSSRRTVGKIVPCAPSRSSWRNPDHPGGPGTGISPQGEPPARAPEAGCIR